MPTTPRKLSPQRSDPSPVASPKSPVPVSRSPLPASIAPFRPQIAPFSLQGPPANRLQQSALRTNGQLTVFSPDATSSALVPLPEHGLPDISFPTPEKGAEDHGFDFDNINDEDAELSELQQHRRTSKTLANLSNIDLPTGDMDQFADKGMCIRSASAQLGKPLKLEQLQLEAQENIPRISC